MQITPRMEAWLEMRGIACSTDEGFRRMVSWSSLTFGLCGVVIGIGTAFASTPLLAVMVVTLFGDRSLARRALLWNRQAPASNPASNSVRLSPGTAPSP